MGIVFSMVFDSLFEQERIRQALTVTRLMLEESLVYQSLQVMKAYDAFACELLKVYAQGEGMIEPDVHQVIQTVLFAIKKHRLQTRKDAEQTAYIIHPIGVAYLLLSIGHVRDPDIIIAALLHDTVEDTETTYEEITRQFSPRVAEFVREMTDDKSLSKQERKRLQIENAPNQSAGAAQIKLADKLYNLKDLMNSAPVDWSQERIQDYFKWAKEVVDRLPWVNASLKQAIDLIIKEKLE